MLYTLLFSITLSIDSLGIGTTYGLKKIEVSVLAKLIMSGIAFLFSLSSILFGRVLYSILPLFAGKVIGAVILILLGISMIMPQNSENKKLKSKEPQKATFFIKWLGISITIIKQPTYGDMDNSSTIDFKEALYIGAALSFDSIGACIGLSMNHTVSIIFPLLIAVCQFIFLSIGLTLGKKAAGLSAINESLFSILPGILLIIIAMSKLIF